MKNRYCLLPFVALGVSTAAAAQQAPATGATPPQGSDNRQCRSSDPEAVVVCGHSNDRYRIDPTVLATTRALEAPPPKPPLDASAVNPCTGQACGGGTIPLVGMALTALKAAELAAAGDDWRDAFRTHPDAYLLYQQQKAKSGKGRVSVGLSAGN